jgi:hypothetical protein
MLLHKQPQTDVTQGHHEQYEYLSGTKTISTCISFDSVAGIEPATCNVALEATVDEQQAGMCPLTVHSAQHFTQNSHSPFLLVEIFSVTFNGFLVAYLHGDQTMKPLLHISSLPQLYSGAYRTLNF